MMKEKTQLYSCPVGLLVLTLRDGCLVSVDITDKKTEQQRAPLEADVNISSQLDEYFSGKRRNFSLPVKLDGTEFQKNVWQEMQRIPHGKTITYGAMASKLNSSPRAVGNACRANPIPVIVPCHRVVAKNGPGGYCGQTSGKHLMTKQWLLQHEGATI